MGAGPVRDRGRLSKVGDTGPEPGDQRETRARGPSCCPPEGWAEARATPGGEATGPDLRWGRKQAPLPGERDNWA